MFAVIVILGLLFAIAITSISKYLPQSRRKTVISSIDEYLSSVVTAINDQEYKFTTQNTLYAIPIECIPLEKGGDNPFGEWLQANNDMFLFNIIVVILVILMVLHLKIVQVMECIQLV